MCIEMKMVAIINNNVPLAPSIAIVTTLVELVILNIKEYTFTNNFMFDE